MAADGMFGVFDETGSSVKVQICETVSVDVETSVDVSVDDILSEFSRQLESCDLNHELPPYRRIMLPLLDFTTKLLARIPVAAIEKCTEAQRVEVLNRLEKEWSRWRL